MNHAHDCYEVGLLAQILCRRVDLGSPCGNVSRRAAPCPAYDLSASGIFTEAGRYRAVCGNHTRNRWAHQNTFSTDDAYRALDSVQRLLTAVSATEADEVGRQKQELLRARFDEEARTHRRRAAAAPVEGQPLAGLKAWREVVTPHRDVASEPPLQIFWMNFARSLFRYGLCRDCSDRNVQAKPWRNE